MSRRRLALLVVLVAAAALTAAIKPRYGGEIVIRLNEPTTFAPSGTSYSNLILSSLLHENFFFLDGDGQVRSNLFASSAYDPATRRLTLALRDNLSFSDGAPLTARHVHISLRVFLSQNLLSASRLARQVKGMRVAGSSVIVELLADRPGIVAQLTAPELVLGGESENTFTGPFVPTEWQKGRELKLQANPFYAGGRPYLDGVRVLFADGTTPDLFLGTPASVRNGFREHGAGVYQNIYLCFLNSSLGQNTRVAVYTLLRRFNQSGGPRLRELHSLTSDEESPVEIRVSELPWQKVESILRASDLTLYALSSLSGLENDLNFFFRQNNLRVRPMFVDEAQMANVIASTEAQILMVDKVFQRKNPIEEKIARVLRETGSTQYSEKYLRMLSELEEIHTLGNRELLMEQVARISEEIVKDGYILPLFQKNFSLYVRQELEGVEIDPYGRPLLGRARRPEKE